MSRRPVSHTSKRFDGTIGGLSFPGAGWSPRLAEDAVRDIEDGRHTYFVPWQDGEVDVRVVHGSHGPYLRSDWDDTDTNNLAELPEPDESEQGDRVSVTTWTRLEPRARSDDPGPGLLACTYDPLWLLGRQWQLGEYAFSDGGSPIAVRVRGSVTRLDRVGDAAGTAPLRPYDSGAAPLEAAVEAGPGNPADQDLGWAARAGQHFLRLLRSSGVGRHQQAYRDHYPMVQPGTDGGRGPDPSDVTWSIVARRVPDGVALHANLAAALRPSDGTPSLPPEPEIPAADRDAVRAAATAWLTWCDEELAGAVTSAATWLPERMEYQFSITGRAPQPDTDADLRLVAAEYTGERLDWYAFDAEPGETPSPSDADAEAFDQTTLPAALTFAGMPAARWWEIEDGNVNLAAVEAPREDLARMLLLEFALVYGNDWFLVPLELPVGSMCHLETVTVTDTFGRETAVEPVSRVDGRWRLFSLSRRGSEDDVLGDVLVLPPVLPTSTTGPPLEEVLLLRDEMANLAWGVERVVTGPTGRPVDRAERYARSRRAGERGTDTGRGAAELGYRLASRVPDYWIPLIPVQVDGREVRFRRGALLGEDGAQPVVPQGRILQPGTPLMLYEEEVPRAGARITRAYEYARWRHGSTLLWMSRRKRTGRGEGSSGLRFDRLTPDFDDG